MDRIRQLKTKIDELYLAKNPERADWADWLYKNHIFVAADYAGKLADKYGAERELAIAAAMLHDAADAVMKRENPGHEEKTPEIARKLLREAGFEEEAIKIVADDALRFHSCRDGKTPQTLEGKVMATADALAHLKTDFYKHAFKAGKTKQWALERINKDFNNKIFFEDVRAEARPTYEKLLAKYESLFCGPFDNKR